ncbi:hypothetical protein EV130_1203 [Rhizobium azibense]|uniref:Uncharacterized protein n=1 Tax=Rhizobium azibense TaxID=1136135 RepID=A0A4R3Q4F0_9HYPH|nr:hypothetical protein [Rhizobium azibense]TCU15619.1 hypothetical protein EV130_1203 [Rhizobium azibense]TCU31377.1 hypothetical protein EV129_1283 [Rhizobium azibense]
MESEVEALSKTLAWTCGVIAQSDPEERQRIAAAYRQAQTLIAGIPLEGGDARRRIVACIERSDTYRAVEDIACVGWIMTAIQERVNERDLPHWRQLRKIIKLALKLLVQPEATVH